MDIDSTGLKRVQSFMELLQRATQAGSQPRFISTPTENGDNINVVVTIDGVRFNEGILFWDLNYLQEKGLVDTLEDDDIELGLNITDGMVEDAEQILTFVTTELRNRGEA